VDVKETTHLLNEMSVNRGEFYINLTKPFKLFKRRCLYCGGEVRGGGEPVSKVGGRLGLLLLNRIS